MMQQGEEEYALFIGGLRRDRKISFLKRKLIELFDDCLGITLAPADVNIIAPPGKRFAFVYLASADEMQSALQKLESPQDRNRLSFDFSEIQNKFRGLSVQVKFSTRALCLNQVPQSQQRVVLSHETMDYNPALRPAQLEPVRRPFAKTVQKHIDENCNEPKNTDQPEAEHSMAQGPDSPVAMASQTPIYIGATGGSLGCLGSAVPNFRTVQTSTTNLFRRPKIQRKQYGNAATSTTGLISPCTSDRSLPDKYLIIGQYVGRETRNVEFKRGGGQYLKKQLKDHAAKYVCSFLNAGEGGSLFIGVDDNGAVQGVECNQRQENDIRLLIDSVIKGIVPQVFPQQYTVMFVPVLELHQDHLTPMADVYVIEIRVEAVGRTERLYETHRGDVYIRRDGSVQGPLRASDIQEWTRMIHRQEDRGRRGELDRMQVEIDNYRQRETELTEEHQRLVEQMKQLGKRGRRRSKACSIM